MRVLFVLLLHICCYSNAFTQFVRIPALGDLIDPNTYAKAKPAGDNDYVALTRGELHHITLSESGSVHIEWMENSIIKLTNFILHDIDQDGDQDIICYRNEFSKFEIYLKVNGRYQFSRDYPVSSSGPYAIHSQDFNGDGIADLFVNNAFFITTGINKRTQVWRYPVANPTQYKYIKTFDYEQDGDFDALFHVDNSLSVLVHTEAEFSLTKANMIEPGDALGWGRMIATPLGERLFYYDSNSDSIRQTVFTPDGLVFRNMLSASMTSATDDVQVIDINKDGTEEIILYSTNPRKLMVLSYDSVLDTMLSTEIAVSSPGTATISGIMYKENVPYFFLVGSYQSSLFRINSDFSLVQEYAILNSLSPRKDGLIDFNGDGLLDVVNENYVRPFAGKDRFKDPVPIVWPSMDGTLSDFDQDGDADLVKDTTWFENTGNYSFGPEMSTGDPTPDDGEPPSREILRIDIDLDGDLDILSYSPNQLPLELKVNSNNVFFEDYIPLASFEECNGKFLGIEVSDADLDGDRDILFATQSCVVIILNAGNLNFEPPLQVYSGSKLIHTADFNDIDSDGWVDVVVGTKTNTSGSGAGEVIIYKGGNGGWQPQIVHEGIRQHAAYFANVDQTGWLDIYFESEEGLFWTTTENGIDFTIQKIDNHLDNGVILSMRDVDLDGDDDVIVYKESSTILNFYINQFLGTYPQSCPEGEIFVRSQVQANRYGLLYPLCSQLPGSLQVGWEYEWSDITDISMFRQLNEIEGDFTLIRHNILDDLSGFSGLERVGGSFTFESYKSTSLLGLQQLRYVGQDVILAGIAPTLSNIDLHQFESLDTIGRSLVIENCKVTHIEPLIQPVFKGDVRLFELSSLIDEHVLGNIDTIRGELELNHCALTTLDSLSDIKSIGSFRLINTGLRNFGAFRSIDRIEGDVIIAQNDYLNLTTGFDSLQWIGGDLEVDVDTCNVFDRLENVGGFVKVISTSLGPISFTHLDSIGGRLSMINCDGIVDLQNFNVLNHIGEELNIVGCDKMVTLYGLESVKGPVTNFELYSNGGLTSLVGLNDSLDVTGLWTITGNTSLHTCDAPPVCRHLSLGREMLVSGNGTDCADISEVRCVDNRFSGFAYHDFNENALKDSTEATLSNIRITLPNTLQTILTGDNGFYYVTVATGDSVTAKVTVPDQWEATTSTEIQVDSFISGIGSNYGNNFGLRPEFDWHKVSITANQGLFVCSRQYLLSITIRNDGTYPEALQLEIDYPQLVKLVGTFTGYSDHDTANHILRINLDTLYPFFTKSIVIPFEAPEATFVGEFFSTKMLLYDQRYQPQSLVGEYKVGSTLFCSFDPNDKLVQSTNGTSDVHLNSADELIYTIRFQNTGNYYAEHVRIADTISETLDINSLTYLASSHPVDIRINGREVYFNFYDIFLPDSMQDPLGSQGYVTFRIKPLSTDMTGLEFLNKADIYFDYNPAIRTNEALSVVKDLTGISNVHEEIPYYIVPNPVDATFRIQPDPRATQPGSIYTIYSISGQKIAEGEYSGALINVSGLPQGLYYLKLNGITSLRFLKVDDH